LNDCCRLNIVVQMLEPVKVLVLLHCKWFLIAVISYPMVLLKFDRWVVNRDYIFLWKSPAGNSGVHLSDPIEAQGLGAHLLIRSNHFWMVAAICVFLVFIITCLWMFLVCVYASWRWCERSVACGALLQEWSWPLLAEKCTKVLQYSSVLHIKLTKLQFKHMLMVTCRRWYI